MWPSLPRDASHTGLDFTSETENIDGVVNHVFAGQAEKLSLTLIYIGAAG